MYNPTKNLACLLCTTMGKCAGGAVNGFGGETAGVYAKFQREFLSEIVVRILSQLLQTR